MTEFAIEYDGHVHFRASIDSSIHLRMCLKKVHFHNKTIIVEGRVFLMKGGRLNKA
jgi:hypothetical protein